MNDVAAALWSAQEKARALFDEVADSGLIRAGVLESELTSEIHALAQQRFGVRRHWHKRLVRCGPNSVLSYYAEPPDRRIEANDTVYLDFGPIFEEWEADHFRLTGRHRAIRRQRIADDAVVLQASSATSARSSSRTY